MSGQDEKAIMHVAQYDIDGWLVNLCDREVWTEAPQGRPCPRCEDVMRRKSGRT